MGIERPIGISALIETAPGMFNLDEIAAACPERMEALIFGVADYAASIQSQAASIGGRGPQLRDDHGSHREVGGSDRELHWGDQWHYPLSRIAVACRANGLRPASTGPSATSTTRRATWSRPAGPRCWASRESGAIHPSQIGLANDVFSPDDRLVDPHPADRRRHGARPRRTAAARSRSTAARIRRRIAADGGAPADPRWS